MHYGLSFLASEENQILPALRESVSSLEAVVFDRESLTNEAWQRVWKNVGYAANIINPERLSFHFPVNNCNYSLDHSVADRLKESFQRASDLGLAGVVVHANNVFPVDAWQHKSVVDIRSAVVEILTKVASGPSSKSTWLGLENMPAMDNHGSDIDPTFIFPDDFSVLRGTGVKVTWDMCHFFNSLESCKMALEGKQPLSDFPNLQHVNHNAFLDIIDLITHWHFSAFKGVPDRRKGITCVEGVLPWDGCLSEQLYLDALLQIHEAGSKRNCIFEVTESNYDNRSNGRLMLQWAYQAISNNSTNE